jgi:hypothetical protein
MSKPENHRREKITRICKGLFETAEKISWGSDKEMIELHCFLDQIKRFRIPKHQIQSTTRLQTAIENDDINHV